MKPPISLIVILLILSANICCEEIIVGISDWPPWKIISKDPISNTVTYSGIDVDILTAISQRTNLEFSYVEAPWKRATILLKNGDIDLLSNFSITAERQQFSDFIEQTYHKQQVVFYTNASSGININSYDDLYNHTIGAITGSAYFDDFDNDESLKKEYVNFEEQLIKMLADNRIDIAIGWEIPFDYSLKDFQQKDEISKSSYHPLNNLSKEKAESLMAHFAFSKNSTQKKHKAEFEEALKELISNGTVQSIIDKYTKTIEN